MERRHLNDAVIIARYKKPTSKQELAESLHQRLGISIGPEYIEGVEAGIIPLSNERFADFCHCLNVSIKQGIRYAKFMAVQERQSKSKEQLLQGIIDTPEPEEDNQ